MKIPPVGAEILYTDEGTQMHGRMDGKTDRHEKANSRVSQFC